MKQVDSPPSRLSNAGQPALRNEVAMSRCILCSAEVAEKIQELDVEQVISGWKTAFQIDIKAEVEGAASVALYRCPECSLEYYLPALAGSERLYSQLQSLPWYYSEDKWEHRVAIQDIAGCSSVLEVGCGLGAFLVRALSKGGVQALGIELSSSAVETGSRMGRPIALIDVSALAEKQPASYDAVCTFQVLEHVPEPHKFLDACVRLLRPGGRLCIGVPNNDGYIGKLRGDLLNQPPHHMSRWGTQALGALTRVFPLRLNRLAFEPLAQIHVQSYLATQLRSMGIANKPRLVRGPVRFAALLTIQTFGLRRLLRGHTIYASYTRIAS